MNDQSRQQGSGGRPGDTAVSLIATVFNEAGSIERFIGSINAQRRLPDEVVIVDGGSTDGTPGMIRTAIDSDIALNLIVAPGLNIAQGRNRAIREARHPLVACSDAGSVLRPDWLEKIVAPLLADPSVDVASGFYSMECHSLLQQCVGLATMPGQLDPPNPDTFLPSARSVAFRKTVWEAAGGYPEWLYTAEDTLFDMKLKKMGYTFRFVGDAIVEWEPRPTWRKVARQFYLYSRGGGHLGVGRQRLMWDAKQFSAFLVLVVAGFFWWPSFAAVGLLLVYFHVTQVHANARRIALRCGTVKAYGVTAALYWLIRIARCAGYVVGAIQRSANKERYVARHDAYMKGAGGASQADPKGDHR